MHITTLGIDLAKFVFQSHGVDDDGWVVLRKKVRQMDSLEDEITKLERKIRDWHHTSEISQRLATIPGVGVLTATALAAPIPRLIGKRRTRHTGPAWKNKKQHET